jgi:CBS domain-containing protein
MRVLDIMRREVRVVGPGTDLATVGKLMAEVGCGVLPVVGDDERVVGVVTDRDVGLELARRDRRPSEVTVRQAMSGEVWACAAGDDIAEALAKMAHHKVRRLPVLDPGGRLLGLLSLDDVVLHAKAFGAEGFSGPYYADVARTLMAICEHSLPVVTH